MFWISNKRLFSASVVLGLIVALLAATPALAIESVYGLRASHVSPSTITVKWTPGSGSFTYQIYLKPEDGEAKLVRITDSTSHKFRYLKSGESYTITVDDGLARAQITVTTKRKPVTSTRRHPDTPNTCNLLPPRITITGHMENTRCQVVDERGVGRSDLIERGVIDALDVWKYVPDNVEVCFSNAGDLVLMDADYAPRMVMELETYERDGMTCAMIDRAGTVVLLASEAPAEAPATVEEPAAVVAPAALPTFDPIPLVELSDQAGGHACTCAPSRPARLSAWSGSTPRCPPTRSTAIGTRLNSKG